MVYNNTNCQPLLTQMSSPHEPNYEAVTPTPSANGNTLTTPDVLTALKTFSTEPGITTDQGRAAATTTNAGMAGKSQIEAIKCYLISLKGI